MSAQIVPLNANTAICPDAASIAERLRFTADRIESGEDHAEHLVLILSPPMNSEQGMSVRFYGRRMERAFGIGLLAIALQHELDQ